MSFARLGMVLVSSLALAACSDLFKSDLDDLRLPDVRVDIADVVVDPTSGKGTGEACDAGAVVPECRFGLSCIDGACRATGASQENRPCILTAECGDGLYCSLLGACLPAGDAAAGGACSTSGDCEKGLVCRSFGFGGACVAAGAGDLDAACAGVEDCQAGLSCGGAGVCAAGSPAFGLRPWAGVTCAEVDPAATPVVHFEVPRSGSAPVEDGDFFRLPFPNDIRMRDGHVDLSGFPTPGPGIVGFDPVARVIAAAEKVQTGFSLEPVVTFRISHGFALESFRAADDDVLGPATLYFKNIDKGSPAYGGTPDYSYFVTDGGSKYICPRYVSVRPSWNTPLLPGTTYAVIIARGVTTSDGADLAADDDMQAMLAESAPGDADLAAAWDAYAPLRAYLADTTQPVAKERVIAAAVFTTQPVSDVLPAVRAAVQAAPAAPVPALPGLVECKAGVTSPCDDGLTGDEHVRGCFAESATLHELHMKVQLPKVQAGTRPYLVPDDGGDVVRNASSVVLQGTEEVCVALTIPKGATMPDAGWPLAIYGHGTGGSFRSGVRDAGEALSTIDLGDGTSVAVATLSWDGPMHGRRQSADPAAPPLDPGALFYNLGNPVAARGNLLQGAADVFALVRAAKTWAIAAADSPTGEAIRFDPARLVLVGHSQGATTGPLASPYEPDVHTAIWSGAGGGLVLSLLSKKEPVDAPLAAAIALQELSNTGEPVPLTDMHPALALVQGVFDAVDPLHHGRLTTVDRDPATPIQHVMLTYGIGDSYTPNSTGRALARATRVQLVRPAPEDFGPAFPPLDAPVKENLTVPGGKATAVVLQARPDGYDGHFVMFRDATLQRRYKQWVGTFVRDGVPTVVP